MVRDRQRQGQLARAKWDRQQARRTAKEQKQRRIAIGLGILVALAAGAALIWLIVHLVNAEDATTPVVPTETTAPPSRTDVLTETPTSTGASTDEPTDATTPTQSTSRSVSPEPSSEESS